MNITKAMNAALLFILCGFASIASADVFVYSDSPQVNLYHSDGTTLHVRYSNGISLHGSVIGQSATKDATSRQIVVVEKLATYWVKPAYSTGRIRVTVPIHYYLTSWDVKALEKELERLGVKIKSRPPTKPVPKPGSAFTG